MLLLINSADFLVRKMDRKMKKFQLFIWVVSLQAVGFFLGMLTARNIPDWYVHLIKSPLTPPAFIFSLVWPLLYVLIAIVGYRTVNQPSSRQKKLTLSLYSIQLAMNWLWTPLFFNLHWLGFSLIWILGLFLLTGFLITCYRNFDRISAWLLLPYWLWLGFATYLNAYIWYYN